MGVLNNVSGKEINQFAIERVEHGSTVKTDGLIAYKWLKHKGYKHERIVIAGGKAVGELFPWAHVAISNFKRFLLGTHHKASSKQSVRYLAEFTYCLNRRYYEVNRFDHLIRAVLYSQATTYKQLIVQR